MTVLAFKLILQEPVLVTAPGGDPNTDESQSYIPGSAIRGALVGSYLQNKSKGSLFTHLFLDGSTHFLNAYPEKDAKRMLPTPEHWKREKDPVRMGSDSDQDWDEKKRRVHDLTQKKVKATTNVGGPFMVVVGNEVFTKRPPNEVAVHNARNREMGRAIPDDDTNRSALFRYHALAADQTFIGRIVVKDTLAKEIKSLLSGKILLGGSHTAGYGLTEIEICDPSDRELILPVTAVAQNEPFFVYLTSDAILRDPETGQTGAYLLEALADKLKGKVKLIESHGRFGWVGGFNNYWGLPLPQTWAMLKGTVWLVTCDQPITVKQIEDIEKMGIGDRRAEGYGRLLLIPQTQWVADRFVPHPPKRIPQTQNFDEIDGTALKLLNEMNTRLVQQEVDRHLAVAVQEIQTGRLQLSNSQLSRIRLKVRQNRKDLNPFAIYLKGTKDRKSADDQFRKSRLTVKRQTLNFREWLINLA